MTALLWALLALFAARVAVQMALKPQGAVIPIFFHWVLAGFVIAVGLWHRRRLVPR